MRYGNADKRFSNRVWRRSYYMCSAWLFAACIGLALGIPAAQGAETHTRKDVSHEQAAAQLSAQVNDDRLTLSVAKVPQVYLYGVIDADAPQRFEAMMKSGKIPSGSDIYLNASDGDTNAGMALGRLFRSGSMVTHLGTPRPGRRSTPTSKVAICKGACAYAYLGGLYRWAPAGNDRVALPTYQAQQTPQQVVSYLKDMGIDPGVLTSSQPTSGDPVVWLNADQMIAMGLANNGRLNLSATYRYESGAPYLELKQTDRGGEHRITLLCKPGGAVLTAYNTVGADHARKIVARGARSYVEINQQEVLAQDGGGVDVVDQSVVISRIYPLNQLSRVASAQAMGAWVSERNGAFRYGFAFEVDGVKRILDAFYNSCSQYAPWTTQKNS